MTIDDETLGWLLDSDPALRWQVERDLAGAEESVWQATRARVATEGFGAQLLALQDADGQWAGGAFFPAGFDFDNPGPGQPWTATTWSLKSLREWGLDPAVLAGTAELLEKNATWEYDDLRYWGGEVDACINGFTLASGAWLGADVSPIARWFVEHQTEEGEAKRDDENFAYVGAWEYAGPDIQRDAVLHKEDLVFENVALTQRSYK